MTARPPRGRPQTRTAILDAALERIGEVGLAKLALEDVARAAGTSRQTVYRYFGSRDALLAAVLLREEELLLAQIRDATEGVEGLRPTLLAACTASLRAVRDHPLLDRLIATEPEAMVPLLTTGTVPVIGVAQPLFEAMLAERAPASTATGRRAASEILMRLLVSYTVNPPGGGIPETADLLTDVVLGLLDPPTG